MPTIRLVRREDREIWITLRRELWPYENPALVATEVDDALAGKFDWGVFIAGIDGRDAGLVEVSLHESAPGCSTSPVGYLEAWYVRPEHRRGGVGRALLRSGEDWVRGRGCAEMASDTTTAHPLSPAAHVACGFEEVGDLCFRKDLEDR